MLSNGNPYGIHIRNPCGNPYGKRLQFANLNMTIYTIFHR